MPEAHAFKEQRKHTRYDETGLTSMFQVIRQLASDMSGTANAVKNITEDFKEHMVTEEKQRQEVSDRIQHLSEKIDDAIKLKDAFPLVSGKPDIHGHRVDHETRIDQHKRSSRLWDRIKSEIVSNTVRGLMLAFLFIVVLGLKDWATVAITHIMKANTVSTTVDGKNND